jgi:hypothetical protein
MGCRHRLGVIPCWDAPLNDFQHGRHEAVAPTELLKVAMLATASVGSERKVLDLGARPRYRECDERARVVVSVRWAE